MAPKTVTFESRYTNHLLIRRPGISQPLPTGGWSVTQPEISYQFEEAENAQGVRVGHLTVRPGQDDIEDHSGWLAPGEGQGVKRDVVAALKAHAEYGRDFWLKGHAPGTVYPRPVEFREELMEAIAALDAEKVQAMIEKERGSHQRAELVQEAETALASIEAAAARIEEQMAAAGEQAPEPEPEPASAAPAPAPAKKPAARRAPAKK